MEILQTGRRGDTPTHFRDSYRDEMVEASFSTVLASQNWDVIHIHHLTHLSMALPLLAASRGIRVVLTLHDAWMSCARGQLVDLHLQVCPGPSPAGCGTCLADQLQLGTSRVLVGRTLRKVLTEVGLSPVWSRLQSRALQPHSPSPRERDLLSERQDLARSVITCASTITAPSYDLLARLERTGLLRDLPPSRLVMLPNIPPALRTPMAKAAPPPLRVVFVGSLIPTKGVGVLMDSLRLLPPGQVEVEVIGPSVPFHRMPGWAELLVQSAPAGVVFRGVLGHTQVLEAIDRAHVLVLPALWPENAPITVREALAGGVPVITSDLGGLPEVVSPGVNGILIPPGDKIGLANAMGQMLDPSRWRHLAEGARQSGVALQVDPLPRWEKILSGETMTPCNVLDESDAS